MIRRKKYDDLLAELQKEKLEKNLALWRRDDQIDDILDALGMRGAYPFQSADGSSRFEENFTGRRIQVTGYTYGRDLFLGDVKLAADATAGLDAAARVAAALKRLNT